MKTEPVVAETEVVVDPHDDKESRPTRALGWIRGHKPISAGVTALVVVAVAGGAIALSQSSGTKAKPKTAVSKNAVIAGYQTQLPALAASVQKSPRDAKALDAYGVALYATGATAKARDQYEAELKVDASNAVLLNNLGNVYRDLGKYDKAVTDYQKSISIAPKSATAYVNLANLYTYTLKQTKLGITTIQAAQKALPKNTDLGVLLGIAYEHSGDKVKARTAYEAVLKLDAKNTAAKAGVARLKA